MKLHVPGMTEDIVVRGNVATTTYLLLNIVIGPGILVISYSFLEAGIGLGILLLIATFMISAFTMTLIVQSANLAGKYSYPDIMAKAFGRAGYVIAVVVSIIFLILDSAALILVAGENASKTVEAILGHETDVWAAQSWFLSLMAMVLIVLPLSLVRDITRLASWSLLSVLTTLAVTILVVLRLDTMDMARTAEPVFADSGVVNSIGILNSVPVHQYAALLLYNSMRNKSESKWSYVVYLSFSISGLIFLITGLAGYATFTGNTLPDLADNYCLDDVLFTAARIPLVVALAITLPFNIFVLREIFEEGFFPGGQKSPLYRHFLVTVMWIAVPYLITVVLPCLGYVSQLNGDIAGTSIAIIMPTATFLKLQDKPVFSQDNWFVLVLLVYGVTVAVGGTVFDIIEAVDGIHCLDDVTPAYCLDTNSTITINVTTMMP